MTGLAIILSLQLLAQSQDLGMNDAGDTGYGESSTITVTGVEFDIHPACGCRQLPASSAPWVLGWGLLGAGIAVLRVGLLRDKKRGR